MGEGDNPTKLYQIFSHEDEPPQLIAQSQSSNSIPDNLSSVISIRMDKRYRLGILVRLQHDFISAGRGKQELFDGVLPAYASKILMGWVVRTS